MKILLSLKEIFISIGSDQEIKIDKYSEKKLLYIHFVSLVLIYHRRKYVKCFPVVFFLVAS